MRAFVGVMVADGSAQHLDAAVALLRTAAATDAGVRWIPRERWHITLAFLGDIDEERVPALARALGHIAHDARSVGELRLRGSGQFDRTLWVGVDAPKPMHLLARAVQDAMRDAGIGVERRPWRPHVTIARARQGSDALTAPQVALGAYTGPRWAPSSVALVESITGPQPQHVIRHEVPLD